MLGVTHLESILAREDLGGLVDTQVEHEPVMYPWTKRFNGILGSIRQIITSRSREEALTLCSALVNSHVEYCVHFCALQNRKKSSAKGHKGDKGTGASLL